MSKRISPEPIVDETPAALVRGDMEALRDTDAHLFSYNKYDMYLAEAKYIPNALREIGRLREITFRQVGEGSQKSIDLDRYDEYFKHLILWHNVERRIIGSYRMGFGKEIYDQYGIDGFYVNELFHFDTAIHPMLQESIEMGRAFVVKDSQQKPYPLFLLWKGILQTAIMYPEYKCILGGVSISNDFSTLSKDLMVEFIRSEYFDEEIAQYVHARKKYVTTLSPEEKASIMEQAASDIKKFDKILGEIESKALRFPVLIKKYIKQNAKVVGFNIDENFNNVVDGLMVIKVSEIPEGTIKPVMDDFAKRGLSSS